jgi:hypothetical protein
MTKMSSGDHNDYIKPVFIVEVEDTLSGHLCATFNFEEMWVAKDFRDWFNTLAEEKDSTLCAFISHPEVVVAGVFPIGIIEHAKFIIEEAG